MGPMVGAVELDSGNGAEGEDNKAGVDEVPVTKGVLLLISGVEDEFVERNDVDVGVTDEMVVFAVALGVVAVIGDEAFTPAIGVIDVCDSVAKAEELLDGILREDGFPVPDVIERLVFVGYGGVTVSVAFPVVMDAFVVL